MASKRFINDPDAIVEETIQGMVQSNISIRRIEGYHVLVRADFDTVKQNQVAVVSGGGSGHEPAMGGYVGDGLLTAAVAGGVFASPSVDTILAAIRTVTGPKGCLLIIMNYTGDRLNFGKAAEQAKTEGLDVELLVVADDCALPADKGITGRRGVCGTVLVHKVAGAAAAAGLSLAAVKAEAEQASSNIGTLGVAMTTCTVPGCPPSTRLDENTIEVGLGIHGEAGMQQRGCASADVLVDQMLAAIASSTGNVPPYLALAQGGPVAVMVNNLGAVPPAELHILAHRAILTLEEQYTASVVRCYVGSFMTSLDMNGASITVMRLDESLTSRLDQDSTCAAWQNGGCIRNGAATAVPVVKPAVEAVQYNRPAELDAAAQQLDDCLKAIVSACVAAEPQLTEWDMIAGDGDCGITAKRGAEQVLADLNAHYPLDQPAQLLSALADSVSASMGGTSGALYELALRAASATMQKTNDWGQAFSAGVDAIKLYGGAEQGYRTMLDALLPAQECIQNGGTALEAAAAAEAGASATAEMEALAGRSNYVPFETLRGTPDPGAKAVSIMMKAAAQSLNA